jgi:hypothetical protein
MRRQRRLNALFYRKEGQWIVWIDAMGVANRDANLPDPAQTFLNELLMSAVKRLVPPDEQSGRLPWIERRAQ